MPITPPRRLPTPALRTVRSRPTRAVPCVATHLHWYFCPLDGAFSHLVLLDGHLPLAHWVLPAAAPEAAAPLPGMWMQVPPATNLAVPAAAQGTGRGTCRLVRPAALPPSVLPAGQLLLHLPAAGAAELYSLTQSQPGGPGWLLRRLVGPGRLDSQPISV